MMLIEIGFRPNNLFISNSSKYFPTYCPSYPHISHEISNKSRPILFNSRKKKLVKRSLTMPYPEEAILEGKTINSKRLETTESDQDRMEGRHRCFSPFKNVRARKEMGKEKVPSTDAHISNGSRLAVEFPMILNLGSVYSSHVVLYLDP